MKFSFYKLRPVKCNVCKKTAFDTRKPKKWLGAYIVCLKCRGCVDERV